MCPVQIELDQDLVDLLEELRLPVKETARELIAETVSPGRAIEWEGGAVAWNEA